MTQDLEEVKEAGQHTSDMAVYKYYAASLGWLSIFLFLFLNAVFASLGVVRCQSYGYEAVSDTNRSLVPHQMFG